MNDCIFCKLINGDIPRMPVYETDHVISFLTIQPVNPGHALVVHKHHHENIFDTPEKDLAEIMVAAKHVAEKVKKATNADGINISMNNGAAAGQAVLHAHVHVIPRFGKDGFKHWPHKDATPEDLKTMTERVKRA